MKGRDVLLVDLGLDEPFGASMAFVEGMIRNLNAGRPDDPIAEVSFVRSRDYRVVTDALTSRTDVLHVMSHGEIQEAWMGPSFASGDGKTSYFLFDLEAEAEFTGNGIHAHTVIADACSTGNKKWMSPLRHSLEHDICYIGTSRPITWHDSTVYCSAFYSALFRKKGRGMSPIEQALEAHERATEAYSVIMDGACPFKATVLTPSRFAKAYVVDKPNGPREPAKRR